MTGTTHLAVECRTNVAKQSIKKDFLSKFTEFLQERFKAESKVKCRKIKGCWHSRNKPIVLLVINCHTCTWPLLPTDIQNIQVDVQPDVLMMRAGSSAPMMNMNFYHNSDKINQTSKTADASSIAKFMADHLGLPCDRVLVLFFDTRKCT